MSRQTLKWAARYDALGRRERGLIAAAWLGALVVIAYTGFIDPALKRAQSAERSAKEYQAQLASLRAQGSSVQSARQNPDAAAHAELSALKKQLADLSGRLVVMERSLIPPQRMAALLEDVIGHTSLRLISLRTLPFTAVLGKAGGGEGSGAPLPGEKAAHPSSGLFRHGIEIRLEGSYQELANYLERLEASSSKLLWSSAALSAEQHPKLVLTLTVFTLSLDRTWLIV